MMIIGFQKKLYLVVQEYIGEYGIPEKLLSTHNDLTFQKFWANFILV